jgi:hypothetical protein
MASPLKKITIFVLDRDDEGMSEEYCWVEKWLEKWGTKIFVAGYSTGGYEHLWDVEGPEDTISEVPSEFLCDSAWSNPKLFGSQSWWRRLFKKRSNEV